ncbi:MAG: DNA translocase FtsK [Candidatus Woykebacteria bacterium]
MDVNNLQKKVDAFEKRVERLEGKVFAPAASQDELFAQAEELTKTYDRISTALIQRKLRVGYARAARLLDLLEEAGLVSVGDDSKPREVLKK